MGRLTKLMLAAGFLLLATGGAFSKELSLSYFMGPRHPMNKAVFKPFADKLAELSGGTITVKQFPGGALNKVPPKQYSILLSGVADIAFHIPGYTAPLFPKTTVLATPGVCDSAVECTKALLRARSELEKEYKAKVIAIWANAPPILLTRDKPVKSLSDLKGMIVRVPSKADVPYWKAMGAAPVSQPVPVINRNLANKVIDAIAIGASGIGSFKLHEPANYLTTWTPGSSAAFVLLMNQSVYNGLTPEQKAWVDEASGDWLSLQGGKAFDAAAKRGLGIAKKNGVEFVDLTDEAKAEMNAAIAAPLKAFKASKIRTGGTVADVIKMMTGK